MQDYLIIPVQRVARYGLLLAGKYRRRASQMNSI